MATVSMAIVKSNVNKNAPLVKMHSKQTMTTNHLGAAFNHSCLKVPVDPSRKLPLPSYERADVPCDQDEGRTNRVRPRKTINFGAKTNHLGGGLGTSPEEDKLVHGGSTVLRRSAGDTASKGNIESYLDFYESIPDYGDINHLSDREFYIKVQFLREKQRSYLKDLDGKCIDTLNKINKGIKGSEKSAGKKKNFAESQTPIKSYTDSVLVGRKYDLDEKSGTAYQSYVYKPQVNLNASMKDLLWEKNRLKNSPMSPVSDTVSTGSLENLTPAVKRRTKNNPVPSIQINNYISDNEENESKTNANKINTQNDKGNPMSPRKPYKTKTKRSIIATNKTRDIHSASTLKPGTTTGDSSSSALDSMWDGLSLDDFTNKSDRLFSDSDDEDNTLPFARSLPSSPILRPCKNVAWKDPNITIPKPFNMTLRDQEECYVNALQGMLLEEEVREEEARKERIIKAHPVPLTSRVLLFDKIMAEQEDRYRQARGWLHTCHRRQRFKRQSMAELRAQMQPFSFVGRNEEKGWRLRRLCRSTPELQGLGPSGSSPAPFRARPVPKNLFSDYIYERMREDEFYRELKKRVRAEELLKASSLPPSMAAREKMSRARALSLELLEEELQEERRRKHKRRGLRIPDYRRSHDSLHRRLHEKYDDNVTTSPQPFSLETSRRGATKMARVMSSSRSSNSSPYEAYSPSVHQKLRPYSALGIPLNRNNLAAVLRIQSARRRIERELSAQQEELRRRDESRLRAQLARRGPAWQALNYNVEEDLIMRIQTRREEEKLRREEHDHFMELMLRRVDRIPTLFERQSQKPKKLQRKNHPGAHRKVVSVSLPNTPELYEDLESHGDSLRSQKEVESSRKSQGEKGAEPNSETKERRSDEGKEGEDDTDSDNEKKGEDKYSNHQESGDEDCCSTIPEELVAGGKVVNGR